MTSSNYKQLFSRINNANHEVKNLYDEYVAAEKRIENLESQLAEKRAEIERLGNIIEDKTEARIENAKAENLFDKDGDPLGTQRIDSAKDFMESTNFTAGATGL